MSEEVKSHTEKMNQNTNDPEIENNSGWTLNRIYHLDL
jgi:hypothetical protein